ncbi:hypothetical protein [Bovine papular stomatitis virus]
MACILALLDSLCCSSNSRFTSEDVYTPSDTHTPQSTTPPSRPPRNKRCRRAPSLSSGTNYDSLPLNRHRMQKSHRGFDEEDDDESYIDLVNATVTTVTTVTVTTSSGSSCSLSICSSSLSSSSATSESPPNSP